MIRSSGRKSAHTPFAPVAVLVAAAGFLFSCATTERYERSANIVDRIYRFRSGTEAGCISNNACAEWNEKNDCTRYELHKICLDSKDDRRMLVDLWFVCSVAGLRYKICRDKPGLCRIEYRACWNPLPTKCKKETYIDAEERHEFLAQSGAFCFSERKHSWGDMHSQ